MWLCLASGLQAAGDAHFVIIGGLGGEPEYAERFSEHVGELESILKQTAGDDSRVHALQGDQATREAVASLMSELGERLGPDDSVALFLIGHGSFDGREYKFNIRGPDFTAARLGRWLDALPAKRQLVVLTSSSSGASIEALKSDRRVVITATKNGRERNATVFARFWVEAMRDGAADADKNDAVTAAEAFRYAEQKVKDYYEKEKRMASEHAVLEGKLASGFVLARLGRTLEASADPELRALLREREAIEQRIEELKAQKQELSTEDYFERLEGLLIELALAQNRIEEKAPIPE